MESHYEISYIHEVDRTEGSIEKDEEKEARRPASENTLAWV
jgi:hypothetical protein